MNIKTLLLSVFAILSFVALTETGAWAADCPYCKVEAGGLDNCTCTGTQSCVCTGSGSATDCTCKNDDGTGTHCYRNSAGNCQCDKCSAASASDASTSGAALPACPSAAAPANV